MRSKHLALAELASSSQALSKSQSYHLPSRLRANTCTAVFETSLITKLLEDATGRVGSLLHQLRRRFGSFRNARGKPAVEWSVR